MKKLAYLFLIIVLFYSCHREMPVTNRTQELIAHWEFYEEEKKEWLKAKVPGSVHLDLLSHQIIDDPYYEFNEQKQRWIEEKNWWYKATFNIEEQILTNQNVELDFKGLDTYAQVYLNDSLILSANNMFRSWKVDVKALLIEGANELRIHFTSPIQFHKKAVRDYPHTLPSGNETADITTKVSNFSRKAAYHFGWDWGPRFVSSGIWKPIYLNIWNSAKIVEVYTTTQRLKDDKAFLNSELTIEVSQAGEYQVLIDSSLLSIYLKKGKNVLQHSFEVTQPKLWWCNGLGKPNLYHQKVNLSYQGNPIDERENTYGIRTIELINKADSIGTSFYFKLNGKAIFMKGANYIPQDLFLTRVTDEQYKTLITSVKQANMNMLRVWGGGIYEKDLFYELCDQNGILVWQDFMFAGSLYPDLDELKNNIEKEVEENILRLRQHPCIALWCGNNEIEVAWNNWGWQQQYGYSAEDSVAIWKSNHSLFHELIPNTLTSLDTTRSYTPTSPLSNWGTSENFNHSSMHYWGVWHGKEPFENFEKNVGRFMVEYGFQSFPNIETLSKVHKDSSLSLNSIAMKHRQKSYIGNGLILQHIRQYFNEPTDFQEFVQLSQETQAKGLRMAIRSHIAKQPHCMGSLFWQLNDCWPGPSWSVIDYYGNKKLAYETVREEFSTQISN